MARSRFTRFVLAGAVLAGCTEAPPTALAPPISVGATVLQDATAPDLTAPIDDAATRATLGLHDAKTAAVLQTQLLAIGSAIRAGNLSAARSALNLAQSTYNAYDTRAPRFDASDRAVIAMALEDANSLLRAPKNR